MENMPNCIYMYRYIIYVYAGSMENMPNVTVCALEPGSVSSVLMKWSWDLDSRPLNRTSAYICCPAPWRLPNFCIIFKSPLLAAARIANVKLGNIQIQLEEGQLCWWYIMLAQKRTCCDIQNHIPYPSHILVISQPSWMSNWSLTGSACTASKSLVSI